MSAAADGDTVLVCPGTYVENIDFKGKAITVRSVAGPAVTVLDGNAADSVVMFASGEGPGSILDGFTIRNGRSGFDTPGFGDGGGVRIANASPSIRGNVIVSNQACSGAGISIRFGSPAIESNTIADNLQTGCSGGTGGGGIAVVGNSTAVIRGNVISHNVLTSADGGGIALFAAGSPTIALNIISGNTASGLSPCAQGGGISMVNQSDATIAGNLIVGNRAGCGGGVYWLVPSGARGPQLTNNTLADNDSPVGSGVFADGFDVAALLTNNIVVAHAGQTAVFCGDFNDLNAPLFRFNNVWSASGIPYGGTCADQTGVSGNISADPLFVNSAAGDYHLLPNSPSVDVGDNGAGALPAIDLDGDPRVLDGDGDGLAVVDMGADEVAGVQAPLTVVVDVKPGSRRNTVNPRSKGMLAVAILTTKTFDAMAVNASTVRFGPASAVPARARFRDVNADGLPDLLLQFRVPTTGIACGATDVSLSGETLDGRAIQGSDVLRTVGCR
ncbi:MAG TPA: right-handed parallel beta-helix repeat-containing protein [Vicinamibacterales bacterium]|nr:right-handed parallel beta-helix repeat-containing protein [Vicinamibacterales bacterium]